MIVRLNVNNTIPLGRFLHVYKTADGSNPDAENWNYYRSNMTISNYIVVYSEDLITGDILVKNMTFREHMEFIIYRQAGHMLELGSMKTRRQLELTDEEL